MRDCAEYAAWRRARTAAHRPAPLYTCLRFPRRNSSIVRRRGLVRVRPQYLGPCEPALASQIAHVFILSIYFPLRDFGAFLKLYYFFICLFIIVSNKTNVHKNLDLYDKCTTRYEIKQLYFS